MDGMRAEPVSAASASAQLQQIAQSGFLALVEIIPGAIGRGLLGAVKGFFLFGLAGAAIGVGGALLARMRWELPLWMALVNAAVAIVALSLAGAYGMGLRAALVRLAEEMERRGVVVALYALLRPALLKAVDRAREAAGPVNLSASVREAIRRRLSEATTGGDERSMLDRAQAFIARRFEEQLVWSVTAQLLAGDAEDAARGLENAGLRRVEEAVSSFIVELFELQITLAFCAAMVASILPMTLYVLLT